MLTVHFSVYSAQGGSRRIFKFTGQPIPVPVESPVVKTDSPAELISLAQDVKMECQREDLTVIDLYTLSMQVYTASRREFDQGTINKLVTMIHNEGVPKVRKQIHGEDYDKLGQDDRDERHERFKRYVHSCLVQPTQEGTAPEQPEPLSYMDEAGRKTSPFDNASPMSATAGSRGVTFEGAELDDNDERCAVPETLSLPRAESVGLAVKDGNADSAGFSARRGEPPAALVVKDVAPVEVSDPEFVAHVQTRADGMKNLQDFRTVAQVVITAFKGGTIDHTTYHQAAWALHRAAKEHKDLFINRDLRKKFEYALPNPVEEECSCISSMPALKMFTADWRYGNPDFERLDTACLNMTRHARGKHKR